MRRLITRKLAHTRPPADPRKGGIPNLPAGGRSLRPFLEDQLTAAAVLMPFVDRPEGLSVLLTQRSEQLKHHAGQISFPGGRIEEHDEGPLGAALRETEEEIGLTPDYISIAGYLKTAVTGTGYAVTPIVGFVRPGFTLTLDTVEVSDAFEVPLTFLLDPSNLKAGSREFDGHVFQYWEFHYEGRIIWGATASMLVTLKGLLDE